MGSITIKRAARSKRGFTLIEMLVVIGIIAVLAGVVIVAVNPARQFALARNTERVSNINAILNAIGQHMADNKGVFATGGCPALTTATSSIDNASGGGTGHLDLATNCLTPTYMAAIPTDPAGATAPSTGYEVSLTATGRTMVCAPLAVEPAISGSKALCVTR